MTAQPKRMGRPEVGPLINVRMPRDLIDWIDGERATIASAPSRAEFIRDVMESLRAMKVQTDQQRAERERGRFTKAQSQMLGEVRTRGGEATFGVDRRRTAEGLASRGLVTWEDAGYDETATWNRRTIRVRLREADQ